MKTKLRYTKWEKYTAHGNTYRVRNLLDINSQAYDNEIQIWDFNMLWAGKGMWNTLDAHKRLLDIIGIDRYVENFS